MAVVWLNIKNNVPALADNVIRPGIVAHYDATVFRITPGCDHRTAIARSMGSRQAALLFFQPGQVVVRQFLECVERDNVPAIDFHSAVVQSFDDAVELALELGIDF